MSIVGDRVKLVRNAIARGLPSIGDLARLASGDSTKALYGDGTFKTPSGGGSAVPSIVTGLIPKSGGGQAGATLLGGSTSEIVFNYLEPAAASDDSVQLPPAQVGMVLYAFANAPDNQTGNANQIALFANEDVLNDTISGAIHTAQFVFNNLRGAGLVAFCHTANSWVAYHVGIDITQS